MLGNMLICFFTGTQDHRYHSHASASQMKLKQATDMLPGNREPSSMQM